MTLRTPFLPNGFAHIKHTHMKHTRFSRMALLAHSWGERFGRLWPGKNVTSGLGPILWNMLVSGGHGNVAHLSVPQDWGRFALTMTMTLSLSCLSVLLLVVHGGTAVSTVALQKRRLRV